MVRAASEFKFGLLTTILQSAAARDQQQVVDVKNATIQEQLTDEIRCYRTQTSSKQEPLQFWKEQEQSLPLLAKCARTFLATQATNCSAVRANSTAGLILSDKRLSLSKSSSESLIWAKINNELLFQ